MDPVHISGKKNCWLTSAPAVSRMSTMCRVTWQHCWFTSAPAVRRMSTMCRVTWQHCWFTSAPRVGNFRQKNNSAEDGIDGTNGYFRRNSGCSAEQKTSEFSSEHFSGRENNSEFLPVETKIEEYSQNSLPNPSAEEKTTRIPFRGKNIKANCRNSVPNHSAEDKRAQHKTRQPKISIIVFDVRVIIEAVRCEFRKT